MRKKRENNDDDSGHFVIASSWLPERWPLEHRTLVQIPPGNQKVENYLQGWFFIFSNF